MKSVLFATLVLVFSAVSSAPMLRPARSNAELPVGCPLVRPVQVPAMLRTDEEAQAVQAQGTQTQSAPGQRYKDAVVVDLTPYLKEESSKASNPPATLKKNDEDAQAQRHNSVVVDLAEHLKTTVEQTLPQPTLYQRLRGRPENVEEGDANV